MAEIPLEPVEDLAHDVVQLVGKMSAVERAWQLSDLDMGH